MNVKILNIVILATMRGGGANSRKIDKTFLDNKLLYLQYFLKPRNEFSESNLSKVFFLQRREEVNFLALKIIFSNFPKNLAETLPLSIHIHFALDKLQIPIIANSDDEKKYNVTYSSWFESYSEMENIMDTCGIYIAPRTSEGIGLSFLHALALGKVIIAHNEPTMSEYITHNVNGYLIDFENPKPLDFKNILEVRKNARTHAKIGYEKWLKDREKIIDFIES